MIYFTLENQLSNEDKNNFKNDKQEELYKLSLLEFVLLGNLGIIKEPNPHYHHDDRKFFIKTKKIHKIQKYLHYKYLSKKRNNEK
jgi:hypothetical protein